MSLSRTWAMRRFILGLAVCSVVPLLAACPKKETPVIADAAPPPPPPEDVQTSLVPMEEDTGVPDAAEDAKPKYTGPAVNTNVARLKQCCNQLATQGKTMGASPEAGLFTQAAAQCNVIAAQAGPTGTAPELGVLRGLLAGRNIPSVCGGF